MKTSLKIISTAVLGLGLGIPLSRSTSQEPNPPSNNSTIEKGGAKKGDLLLRENLGSVYSVALTGDGKKWIEKQKDTYQKTLKKQDGGLIDASTFLSESDRKILDKLANESGGIGIVKFTFKKLNPKENGYQYALYADYHQDGLEKWYISSSPYYTDQFPEDLPPSFVSFGIWKGTKDGGVDKLIQHELKYEKIVTKSGEINFDYLLRMIDEAKESRKSELADMAKIKNFDLPKNELIGYIGLADSNLHNDPVLSGIVEDVGFLPELMSKAGYNFVTTKKGRNAIQVMSDPKKIVEEEVEAFRKRGVKNIYLKLSSHGNETGTYFLGKKGYNIFTPRDLIDVLNKFQDCKFVVTTDACHNGGLSDAIKRYKDPSGQTGRVYLFAQSKISGFNQEGRLKGTIGYADIKFLQIPFGLVSVPALYKAQIAPKVASSYYDIFFYNHILNGEPYGRAHLKADEDTKKIVPCDANGTKSTPNGGITTSMLEQGNSIYSL
ncbi:MAG: hypothetical protein HY094_00770 [Candidatus Melainabacteria bacterium]|nr:hypothetical protein [Candidatus Melainabacteria bacterium]